MAARRPRRQCVPPGVVIAYLDARCFLEQSGYGPEIEWQERVRLGALDESQFLAEFAWVVLSAGMRETVVRKRYADFSYAFLDWHSAAEIVHNATHCREAALRVFCHERKVDSILEAAAWIDEHGVTELQRGLETHGASYLRRFQFMGPATSLHLAKNLGVQVAKPDRHLIRLAQAAHVRSAARLCREISRVTAHPTSVVDLVLWRYATLDRDYARHFREAAALQLPSVETELREVRALARAQLRRVQLVAVASRCHASCHSPPSGVV